MNRSFTNAAGRYVGLGLGLVLAVALATSLFSFVGTITCAALVGMMLGTARQWRWPDILVSLVFPVVLMAFLPFEKGTAALRDNVRLSLVSFGAFWITFLLSRALLHFERQTVQPPGVRASKRAAPQVSPAMGDPTKDSSAGRALSYSSRSATEQPVEPGIDELQGDWSLESTARNGQPNKKVLSIDHDRLAVSVLESDGQMHCVSRGDVRLERLGPFHILRVLVSEEAPPSVSKIRPQPPRVWVYQLAGETLTVASNFEETAGDRHPAAETYIKVRDRSVAEQLKPDRR